MEIQDEKFEEMLSSLQSITVDNVREKLMQLVPNYKPAEND